MAAVAVALIAFSTACAGGDGESPSAASDSSSATISGSGVQAVVEAANAFSNSLTDEQKSLALLDLTQQDAVAWSNLPCGQSCRGGVPLEDLDDDQAALAETLLKTAIGTDKAGYTRVEALRTADDYLAELQSSGQGGGPGSAPSGASGAPSGGPPSGQMPSGGPMPSGGQMPSGGGGGGLGGYGAGLYDLALLGDPSANGTWMLHFGGHHLAINFTYKNGQVSGASPYFVGVEPTSFTGDDGTQYAPMEDMADAVKAVTAGLSTEQLGQAKLKDSFTDVLLGPGEDGQFPETKQGVQVSTLNDAQKQAVLAAMRTWVGVADDSTAQSMMSTYESELDSTYISYSGGTDLTEQGDYFRIDGPSVWIEFVCQNGVVVQNQVHYHTIWRDHTRDYGGEFSF
ncbi:DUF3500 domain-containing protein [Gordonia sp. C13]|uniref:DUF3500 domain-containing protein n=1 Tax=Gordonia sp. C13 TaxID=2935078 RepID=UPI00200AC88F|nr:DUF3500 domain-containing protein [Gordonia sp. C13]MCK8616692.1 DUF3500 domain-containing protein [Gordonia sp. C13]